MGKAWARDLRGARVPMKRNAIVFGFVGSCVGIAFKGTAQPSKRRATKFRFVRPRCNRAGNFGPRRRRSGRRAGLLLESIAATNPGQALVSVRKHFESFESLVIQSGDLIREGHHRCGRRRTADVTTAAN